MRRLYLYRNGPIILLLVLFACTNAYALQGSTAANGSNAQAVHDIGITGAGINIGFIAGGNVLATHQAFQDSNGISHAVNYDVGGIGFSYIFHDTPLAGIIISRGTPDHPNDIGVAPDAFVHCVRVNSYDLSQYQNALDELIVNQSCKVIVTGLQFPYDPNKAQQYAAYKPDGNSSYTKMYDYYAHQYDVVFANAAGNYVKDSCSPPHILYSNITIFGDAYNGITTGGLAELPTNNYSKTGNVSSMGCTLDGRRKPDIMAPSTYQVAPGYSSSSNNYWNTGYGDGATSWAVPHTAGVAALLLEYANQTTELDDGHNEVIKAVIVNSAFPNIRDKSGNFTDPANQTWHPHRGYGRIDALRAIDTLSAGKVNKGTTVITSTAGWAYDTINSSVTHTYLIAGEKNERLVLTVAWNRMITKNGSTYSDESSPKFNIDITVKNPSGVTIFSEIDDGNNLEKIDLLLPSDGNYTVSLHNTTSKSRPYGLAFEILPPLTGDFNIDYAVDEDDLSRMTFDWLTDEPDTDIIPDGIVNNLDFAAFADNWLKIDGRYYNP